MIFIPAQQIGPAGTTVCADIQVKEIKGCEVLIVNNVVNGSRSCRLQAERITAQFRIEIRRPVGIA